MKVRCTLVVLTELEAMMHGGRGKEGGTHLASGIDRVGGELKLAIGWQEGHDSIALLASKPNARVEVDLRRIQDT